MAPGARSKVSPVEGGGGGGGGGGGDWRGRGKERGSLETGGDEVTESISLNLEMDTVRGESAKVINKNNKNNNSQYVYTFYIYLHVFFEIICFFVFLLLDFPS